MGLENPLHLLVLGVIVIALFGAKRLPEIGRTLGKGVRDVKSSVGLDEIVSTPKQIRAAITDPLTATKADAPAAAAATVAEPVEPDTGAS